MPAYNTRAFAVLLALGLGLLPVPARAQSRFVGLADVTVTNAATLVRAANASRIALVCTNSGDVNVRIGGSTVTATRGMQLRNTNRVSIAGPFAVYAISEGANTTLSCSEVLR